MFLLGKENFSFSDEVFFRWGRFGELYSDDVMIIIRDRDTVRRDDIFRRVSLVRENVSVVSHDLHLRRGVGDHENFVFERPLFVRQPFLGIWMIVVTRSRLFSVDFFVRRRRRGFVGVWAGIDMGRGIAVAAHWGRGLRGRGAGEDLAP